MPEFKVLGATEVRCGPEDCTPTAAKVRQILALLLLRAGTVVPMDMIIEELWGDDPPRSAVPTAQTYVYQLRRPGSGGHRHDWLATRPPGYRLVLTDSALDSALFEASVRRARVALAAGRAAEAADLLERAQELWTGPALADVAKGRHLDVYVFHLEELRLRALELGVQAGFALGRERELVAELRPLTARYPLNEWFHSRLIAALATCGRRGEALEAYRNLCGLLDRELGLEPSEEIERLQASILRDPPVLNGV
ncbi:MAG TPA: AfsR/SARP family transcriptional regulator [Kribbellaceae bacterium]|nr:AfsR/SARP family transcriptional regulator [Kribbellaceae bacterium]